MHALLLARVITPLVLALLSAVAPAQQVLVVGNLGHPAAEYTDIQQAIDAASDGDVLLPNFVGEHAVIADKSLVLAGASGRTR
jgi:hypothetical protein